MHVEPRSPGEFLEALDGNSSWSSRTRGARVAGKFYYQVTWHLDLGILVWVWGARVKQPIIQSGEAPFQQARSLHPSLGSSFMLSLSLSPNLVAQPDPSYPGLCLQDTTSPHGNDHGGNIYR